MLQSDWGATVWPTLRWREFIVLDEFDSQYKTLRVTYPKGTVGPNEGGFQELKNLDPREEYYRSYRVRFEPDFDFQLGSNRPGLTSGGA